MPKYQTSKEALQLLFDGQLCLANVQRNGVRVDKKYLESAIVKIEQDIETMQREMENDRIASEWRKLYGDRTNFGSREQLSDLLFVHLGFKSFGTTSKGSGEGGGKVRHRTDKTALEKIDNGFVKTFLQVEEYKKAKSTYLEGIWREMVERDGMFFIHPSFHLNLTQTFRSSSSEPNFQNVPVRNAAMAEIIRRCYIPRPGRHFVEIDFAQIEVRVSACYNKDPALIRYIQDKSTDMHRDQACAIFGLKPAQVTKEVRHTAKNMFVFPEFYGSAYFQCAPAIWDTIDRRQLKTVKGTPIKKWLKQELGITELGKCDPKESVLVGTFEYHLKKVEERMWKKFHVYSQWKKDTYEEFLREGGCRSYVGFAFCGQYGRNDILNYRIQCDAFMCELWSLIRLDRWLRKNKLRTLAIGEIHDSTQLDVSPKEIDDVLSTAHQIMTEDLPRAWEWLIVPIETETEVAPINRSWFEKSEWVSKDGKWSKK